MLATLKLLHKSRRAPLTGWISTLHQLATSENVYISDIGLVDGDREFLHQETRNLCRCSECVSKYSLSKNIAFVNHGVQLTGIQSISNDYISARWSDGHKGFIPRTLRGAYGTEPVPSLLEQYLDLAHRKNSAQKFWTSANKDEVLRSFQYEDVAKNKTDLQSYLVHFMKYGIGILSNCPLDPVHVINNDLKCGPVQGTIYGIIDEVAYRNDDTNAAYTSDYLPCHTDLSYYIKSPSVFGFFCQENTTTGGESLYVDTFAAMNQIRIAQPDMFHTLCNVDMYYRYAPPGKQCQVSCHKTVEMRGSDIYSVVDQFHSMDELQFVANTDIASRIAWWGAYSYYKKLVNQADSAVVTKLQKGDLVLMDNWRVMHGRNSFVGEPGTERKMNAMYADWSHVVLALLDSQGLDTHLELHDA